MMRIKFILNTFIWPCIAILFFSLTGIGLIFLGENTIRINCIDVAQDHVTVNFTQEHFWGLVKFKRTMDYVKYAEIVDGEGSRVFGRIMFSSVVVLVNDKGNKQSLWGSASLNRKEKNEMVEKINANIVNHSGEETFKVRNVVFWIGIPFLLMGILGIVGWPDMIAKAMKEKVSNGR